jgi:uncharacterized protein (TIGR02302 family)
MSTETTQVSPKKAQPHGPNARKVAHARLVIFFERAFPVALLVGAPLFALIALSLFDAWSAVPQAAHAASIVIAAMATGALLWLHRRQHLAPTRREALARLERDGGIRHEALQSLEDAPAIGGGALWQAHLDEMRRQIRAARIRGPHATANRVDPFGLRYAALAMFVVGLIEAGGDLGARLYAGFIPADPRANRAGYADVWIEPPAYTARAPIYLMRAADRLPGLRDQVDAPEGSIVRAQIHADARWRLSLATPDGRVDAVRKGQAGELILNAPGVLTLRAGGRAGRWPVGVIDDQAPEVDFLEAPSADRDGRLAFSVRIEDDYGVATAMLRIRLDPDQERPLDAPALGAEAKAAAELVSLDGVAGKSGDRAVAVDLSSHPWAGLAAIVTLVVTDAAGQSAETPPAKLVIPARAFFNPLAKAVIEQRQSLAVAPGEWRRVEWAFNGVTLGPEHFFERPTEYLLLRTAMWRVSKQAGGDYADTVAAFWPLALQLEDETLELARRRLEAAKDALRRALAESASNETVDRLTEELRAALQSYLQALAAAGGNMDENDPPADETIDAADLDSMLDSIRDLAKSGSKNAAEQALADLENLLDNLKMSGRGQGAGDGEGDGSGGVGKVGEFIARQRDLADRTFERGERRGAIGDDLGEEESALASELSEFIDKLKGDQSGGGDPDPGGKGAQALARGLEQMRRAQSNVTDEDFDGAVSEMNAAIASLREGAAALAQGQAGGAQARRASGVRPRADPLGRPVGEASGRGVEVPEKSDAQRARELIEALRRRLSDGERSDEEIEYLERLLKRF